MTVHFNNYYEIIIIITNTFKSIIQHATPCIHYMHTVETCTYVYSGTSLLWAPLGQLQVS